MTLLDCGPFKNLLVLDTDQLLHGRWILGASRGHQVFFLLHKSEALGFR
jgi:hypothetical protein